MIEDDQQALNGMNCENTAARMEALERFDILDTERDAVFDSIAVLAAALLDTPIAVVNFITDDRQFFKAEIGIGTRELPLDVSICRFAFPQGGLFVIPDLTTDHRFDNNPLVHVEEGLRFYAGYVLESAGVPLGTVCVLDRAPRPQGLTDAQEMGLKALGVQTLAALERSAEARRDRFTLALTEKMWDANGPVEMMGMATAHRGQYLRVSQVGFAEVDSDQAHLRVDRDWSTGPIASVVGRWHMDDFGETSILAMKAGQTLVIDDILTDSRTNGPVASASYTALGARSVVVVPLVSAGLLVATLFIHHNEPHVWHKDEIALIEDTAARLWGAVWRARADADVKTRSRELETLIGTAPIGFAYFDRAHRYLRINEELAAINGLPADDHIGVSIDDLLPTNAKAVSPILDTVFATGKVTKTIEISGDTPVSLVRDARGEPAFFIAVAEDIAVRKYAEFALSDSEARLRAVIDAAPVGLIFANADGEITGGNVKVEEIIGHSVLPSPDDDAPVRWISFHPDGRQVQRLEYPLASVILGEADRAALDVLYQCGDGRKAWVRFVAAAMRNANGALIGGVVASLDIDREKRLTDQLEQEVQVAVAERDRLWETAEDLLKIAEFDGTIIAINPAWATTLGWSDTELVGSKFWGLIHPDDLPSVEALVRALTNGEKSAARFECRYRAKDGNWHCLALPCLVGIIGCWRYQWFTV